MGAFSAGRKTQEVVVPQLLHTLSNPADFLDRARSCEQADPGVPCSAGRDGCGLCSTPLLAATGYMHVHLPGAAAPRGYTLNPKGWLRRAGPVRCGRQLAVLLSADSAALGMWQDGVLERHKVLTGYTVRRSAGKAQLTHLRRWAHRAQLDALISCFSVLA